MLTYTLKRLLLAALVALTVSGVSFGLLRLSGDVATALAGADAAPDCLAEAARTGETEAGGDPAVDADGFEKEKWRRSKAALQRQLEKESSRAAALHFRYFKAVEDNKTLQMNLAAAQSLARSLEEQVAGLKEELALCRAQGASRRESETHG